VERVDAIPSGYVFNAQFDVRSIYDPIYIVNDSPYWKDLQIIAFLVVTLVVSVITMIACVITVFTAILSGGTYLVIQHQDSESTRLLNSVQKEQMESESSRNL
jgi:hypothetical protein